MDSERSLWPYGTRGALLAAPVIWATVAVLLAISRRFVSPKLEVGNVLLGVVAALGFVPLFLVLLDYIAASRGAIDIKGIKIDFSQAEIRRVAIELPQNMGNPGAILADSSPMQVISALEEATHNPIACLDLRDGKAWWVTRLMALSAGAVRAGSPSIFVFVGMKEDEGGAFLGWARASSVLRSITNDDKARGPQNVTYGDIYRRSLRISKQVAMFADPVVPDAVPFSPGPWTFPSNVPPAVARYLDRADYKGLGDAALEQVLMDQLVIYGLENPPDRLTFARLNELFGHCLYQAVVDVGAPMEQQISTFLDSNAPFLATARKGRYEGLVERTAVERIILGKLFANFQKRR